MIDLQVGIIIPAYNCAALIGETIKAIKAQSHTAWHCVIVDDGSTDDSLNVIRNLCAEDARFTVVTQPNGGVSAARTKGLALLPHNCQYVTFMDNDDVWLPHALERLVETVVKNPNAAGAHGLADMIDMNGLPIHEGGFASFGKNRIGLRGNQIVQWDLSQPSCFESLIFVNTAYPPGVLLIKKSLYEAVGPWDPSFAAVQDWDMLVRISRHAPIEFIPTVIIHYRRHDSNGSNNHARNVAEGRRLYHKIYFSPENSAHQREVVRRGWKAWQRKRISEGLVEFRDAAKRFDLRAGMRTVAKLFAYAVRLFRGYPRPSGI